MAHDNRRLTEKEIQQVFRRAAELQEKRGAELAEWGPTPAEVMKLGEELGMDADSLRAAVDEVLGGVTRAKRGFWGDGFSFESDRTYDAELTDDDWHELLQHLRSRFGRTGSVAEVAGAREWDGSQAVLDPIHLSARSKGGSTRVSIKSDTYGAAVVTGIISSFSLLIIALAISKAAGLPAITEWLISAGIFGAAAAAWRKVMGWMGTRRRMAIEETERAIEQLVDRLESAPTEQSAETEQLHVRT